MKPSTRLKLTFIAGFCDTATFIHMDEVFSAHVTGNFVLFAAAIAQGIQSSDWLKILTFPVFILGIIIATIAYVKVSDNEKGYIRLLQLMTLIFISCAILSLNFAMLHDSFQLGLIDIIITMLIVLAMAIQNTIHHFIPGPMTTVMTGTVMNTTAHLTEKYLLKCDPVLNQETKIASNPLWPICIFAAGCLSAGFLSIKIGLVSVFIPVVLMLSILFIESRQVLSSNSEKAG